MRRLAILVALALAGCAGQTPEPIIKAVTVEVPVARSCVPSNLGPAPKDLPTTLDAFKARLRSQPDIAARYQVTLDWAAGFMARAGEVEPVIAGCRDKTP